MYYDVLLMFALRTIIYGIRTCIDLNLNDFYFNCILNNYKYLIINQLINLINIVSIMYNLYIMTYKYSYICKL